MLVISLALASGRLPVLLIASERVQLQDPHNTDQTQQEVSQLTATKSDEGVMLQWQSIFKPDNLGFNIYRLEGGNRTKVNGEVIPGFVFLPAGRLPIAAKTFSYLDRNGRLNSTYVVESVTTVGALSSSPAVRVDGTPDRLNSDTAAKSYRAETRQSSAIGSFTQTGFPASEEPATTTGRIEDQWAIASQPGLKISINHDGWYRVTEQQMVAAGFSPTVDISNLQLYVDGREIGIKTSKGSGPFMSGDYFEFFGQGLDLPTTDSRIYYLLAGTQPGKRVTSDLHANTSVTSTLEPKLQSPVVDVNLSLAYPFFTGVGLDGPSSADPPKAIVENQPLRAPIVTSSAPAKIQSKIKKKKRKKTSAHHSNHAANLAQPTSFTYTVQRKDRLVYFVTVLNGDMENYFGQVISSAPVSQTLVIPNPDSNSSGSARLEVALQGVGTVPHQIEVRFNTSLLGTMNFFGIDHLVQHFDVPASLLINGPNILKFTSTIPGTVCIADYARLTYAHTLMADNDSLRLSLRPTQSVMIDGFTTPNIRLVDYTDPAAVKLNRPAAQPTANGFGLTVDALSTRAKARLLYALPDTQFDTPASLSLNQPSTLNLGSNGADLLIIAHSSLIANAAPLVSLRQSEGLQVSVVDIEDVYDEFSYGLHGPQAVKDFLSRAHTSWTRPPRYVILLGDASLDPRNYQHAGNFDLVPTKLLDATFSETASDDWLSDFDNDGLAEIPIGRLPVRTSAQANLIISKIVSFSPTKVPQSAMLVADDPTGYFFNFEQANDQVQTLMPAGFTVQRINRRTDPDPRTNLIRDFNAGQALVNYTGHGNVDTWTGANILTSTDASKLTNAVSVVLSQVYGGGGEPGASLRNDYIEIFNRGGWPVNLNGWSVQYAAANSSTWQVTNLPNVVVPPGKYFLVQEAHGPGGTIGLPAPDAVGTIDLDSTAGKVALVNSTTALTGTGCPLATSVVDLLGYGAGNCSQGSSAASLSATTAELRSGNGCANTNINAADFSAGTPLPRNSATAANVCVNSSDRLALSFVVVMDCLNGYFQDPVLQGMAEALMNAPNGGSVAAFASSGLTVPDGQHAMAQQLYTLLYGAQSIPLGDAIRTAKAATTDIDVRHTWIFFGDPSMKIR